MTKQTGHVTLCSLVNNPNASSIGMLLAILLQMQFSSLLHQIIQFITFISVLTLSPLLGAKICHIHGMLLSMCDWLLG